MKLKSRLKNFLYVQIWRRGRDSDGLKIFAEQKSIAQYMKKQFGGNENESIEYEPVWAGVLADYYNNWDSADIFRLGSYRDSWQNNGMVRLSNTINEQARLNNIENIILVVADIGGHWIARWKSHFNKKFSRLHCSWENLKCQSCCFKWLRPPGRAADSPNYSATAQLM